MGSAMRIGAIVLAVALAVGAALYFMNSKVKAWCNGFYEDLTAKMPEPEREDDIVTFDPK